MVIGYSCFSFALVISSWVGDCMFVFGLFGRFVCVVFVLARVFRSLVVLLLF